MRLVLLSLLLPLAASATTIRDAYARYMEEGEFQYLTEFFTGREYTGNRLVLRTDPAERTGQYFHLSLDTRLRDLPGGAVVELEVISSREMVATRHVFPLDAAAKPRSRQILLGLTGEPWNQRGTQPVAWRAVVKSGDTILAEWKSFLWEMP